MSRSKSIEKFAQEEAYDIVITGRHVQVTEAMKAYAQEKIGKIERFHNRVTDVAVTMDIQKLEHRIDIIMRVDHTFIKVHATSDNMYASIDEASSKLQAKLRKYNRKLREHHAKPLQFVDVNVNILRAAEEDVEEVNAEIEKETQKRSQQRQQLNGIVKRKTIPLKTLTYNEASMKMELSEDPFLVFRNEADQKIKVIYRRNDGCYGVIEPE
jgi:putative sigma-54 modulation protein